MGFWQGEVAKHDSREKRVRVCVSNSMGGVLRVFLHETSLPWFVRCQSILSPDALLLHSCRALAVLAIFDSTSTGFMRHSLLSDARENGAWLYRGDSLDGRYLMLARRMQRNGWRTSACSRDVVGLPEALEMESRQGPRRSGGKCAGRWLPISRVRVGVSYSRVAIAFNALTLRYALCNPTIWTIMLRIHMLSLPMTILPVFEGKVRCLVFETHFFGLAWKQ